MEPIPASAELSLRRSRVRARVLLAVASLGEGYLGLIARVAGVERRRARAALFGAGVAYRVDRSLVALGLVEAVRVERGVLFRVTRRGLRKARSLLARSRRSKAERLTWVPLD